ncbi:MAG TPA: cbb3-type cytochrome oxidase assembly protein CcoS [Polyangiaceae bacterium]
MTVLFVVLPLAVLFSGVAVGAFLWATGSGQLDDLETPPLRVLRDGETAGDRRANDEPS